MVSAADALSQITDGMTVDQLRALANTVDASVGNATLILYSGDVGPTKGFKLALALSEASDTGNPNIGKTVKTIADTEISNFLEDTRFEQALNDAVNDPDYNGPELSEVLSGKDANDIRVNNTSFWDNASSRLVDGHNGDFRAIMPDLPDGSVAADTEIPKLLEKNIAPGQKLNGIDLQDWQDRHNAEKLLHGEDIAKAEIDDVLKTTSRADLANTSIGEDADGKVRVSTDGDLGKKLGLDPQPLPDDISGTRISSLADLNIDTNDLSKLAKYGDLLTKAGILGDVLGVSIAVGQSLVELAFGNEEKAGEIIIEAVGELIGGGVAGVAAAGVVGAIVTAAGVPALTAMALVGAAGLAGGYLGGEAAGQALKDLYSDLADMGVVPFSQGLLDDYGWALGNSDAIIGELPPWLQDALAPIFGTPGERPALSGGCPLIIDLDGDGIELISLENSSVHFDFLGNDAAVKMGWAGADDGFLVHDLNGDGKIESVDEMFGSKYGLAYLMTTFFENLDENNGFAALEMLDSNSDGKISALDTVWNSLQVWKDANSDGVTDAGELITLDAAGIESIDLAGVAQEPGPNWPQIEGHQITHASTVTMSGGATREIVDAWLNTDLMDATYAGDYTLDVRTLFLPTMRGYGQLPDLHIAMSLDNGAGGLLEQVQAFAVSRTFEDMFGQFDTMRAEVEDILYAWAGIDASDILANPDFSDNGLYNLMPEYHFVRTFMGQNTEFVGTWLDRTGLLPQVKDGVSAITEGFQNIADTLTARLVFQSGGNALFDSGVSYSPFTDTFEGVFTLSQTALDLLETEATGHADVLGFWNNAARFIDNTQGIENLSAGEVTMLDTAVSDSSGAALGWSDVVNTLSVNVLQAADGGVVFTGTDYDDEITGGDGNDILIGGDGDDVFIEDAQPGPDGTSDDVYIGGRGNDTYLGGYGNNIFQYDYGDDVILLSHGGTDYITTTDVIRFGAGIAPEDVSFHLLRVLNNTPNTLFNVIKIAGRGTISIQDFSTNPDHYKFIDELHFDDGTIIDFSTYFATYHGDRHDNSFAVTPASRWQTLGDVAIYGYEGNDQLDAYGIAADRSVTMYGGAGDDTFATRDTNGVVYGGSGNDVALLGSGDDIYHYESGNDIIRTGGGGQNTIVLPENVTMNDLSFWRYSDPRKGSQQILDAKIDVEGFGSISIWNQFIGTDYQIVQTLQFHDGSTAELADQSYLTLGTDGNDTFSGGYGWPNNDDTYLFSPGNDVMQDSSGTDTLLFGPGITFSDLNIYRVAYVKGNPSFLRGSDLIIEDQNGNSMKIQSYDYNGQQFNGHALEYLKFSDGSVVNLLDLEIEVHGTDAAEGLHGVNKDASPDDTLFGYGGDDDLYGGEGNDILHGGAGDDYVSGDNGIDESVYQGRYADFSITSDSNFMYVSDTVGNEGTDTLYQVETLRFADGTYDVASGVFTPALINAAPVAEDDSAVTAQDTSVIIDVLSNDSDPDGDPLSVTQFGTALHGSVVQNANGTLTYTPGADFSGADSFTYTVSDGVDTGSATVNIDVQAATGGGDVNNALQTLVQNADYEGADAVLAGLNAQEMGSLSGDTLSALLGAGIYLMSDSGDYLYNAGSYHSVHSLGGNDTIFGGTNNSRLFGGDGHDKLYDYRGGDDYLNGGDGDDYLSSGDGDDILYGGDGADTLVGGAGADTFVFRQGDSGIDKIYMNIADADRLDVLDMLTGYDPAQNALGDFVQLTSDGFSTHVFVDADGQGPGNATEIAVLYGNSGVNIQDVIDTGSVVNANNSPIAVNDSVVTTKNTAKVIDILNNDSDPDGDPLSVTQLGAALHGSVVQNANGTLTYTPGANFSGADSFTYTISDGVDTDTASVFVQVTAVNAAPVAEDDSAVTAQDTSVIIDVLSNDSDPDGDPLSVTQFGTALHGSVVQNANGTLTYTPGADFSGADSFTYTVSDGVDSGSATVNIDVQAATGGGDVNNALQTLVQNADYEGADAVLAGLNVQEMGSLSGDTLSALLGAGIYLMSDSGDYLYNAGSYHSVHSLDGNDKMLGGTNNSRLFGGSGDDTLYDYRGGDDYLDGGSGNDTLSSGDGDDILYGGDGADTLVGGAGADTFVFRQGDSGIDKIYMNIADGDQLDVSDLISAYDPLSDAINDFVQITDNGANSTLSVDVDGGGDSFVQIASLAGVTGLTNEEALETSGILITV